MTATVATLPDKATLATAKTALAEAGAPKDFLPQAIKAFGEGAWTADTLDSWIALNSVLWAIADKPADAAAIAAQRELADKAFEGKGSASSRAALVRKIGIEATNRIARKISDFLVMAISSTPGSASSPTPRPATRARPARSTRSRILGLMKANTAKRAAPSVSKVSARKFAANSRVAPEKP